MERRSATRELLAAAALAAAVGSIAHAQVQNLRITEVLPETNQVEVMNTGDAFTTGGFHWTCYVLLYDPTIPNGTPFDAGERKVFDILIAPLNNTDSDLWLYANSFFDFGQFMVHGLKYGPTPNVGRTGLAASVDLWPSASAFVPSPPLGMSIVYEGFGFHPHDWYINANPSLGSPHTTPPGIIADTLEYPSGIQTFEDMDLGHAVTALEGWVVVNTGSPERFSIRAVSDVMSQTKGVAPHPKSTRWLRIRDRDDGDVQNRFYSPPVTAPEETDYTWSFLVNLETMPPGGSAAKPRFTIQHVDTKLGFANAWGIEFAESGASLIVTGVGGASSSAFLYPISGETGIGEWVKIDLTVNFQAETVAARINDGEPVSLPIEPEATMDRTMHRFCYRGEGTGNEVVMLLDDVAVEFHVPSKCPGDLTASGSVGVADLLLLLSAWGPCTDCEACPADLTASCSVGVADLLVLLGNWGPCP